MARYVFPYERYAVENGQFAARPTLQTTLIAPSGRKFTTVALVDSGADYCVFPLSFAPELGLDIAHTEIRHSDGMGSHGNVVYCTSLTVEINSSLSFKATIGFSEAMEDLGFGILGQDGFFSQFNVLFDYREGEFCVYEERS